MYMGILSNISNFFKHENDWVLIGTIYADPQSVNVEVLKSLSPTIIEKLLFGTTTYVWQNKVTSQIKKEEHLGTDYPALKQVLDRVDTLGKFDLTDGDKKYVVVKLQNQ